MYINLHLHIPICYVSTLTDTISFLNLVLFPFLLFPFSSSDFSHSSSLFSSFTSSSTPFSHQDDDNNNDSSNPLNEETSYGEVYTGGKDGSHKNYPGCNGVAPLVIPSDRVIMHFFR